VIKELHEKGLDILFRSEEPQDNGAQATIRNICLKHTTTLKELKNEGDYYSYHNGLVLKDHDDDKIKNMKFLNQEWKDWCVGVPLNSSNSEYKYPEIWEGKFQKYCYSDRLGAYLYQQFDNIKKNPQSRQNFLSIWTKDDEGNDTVPCTIGYNVQIVDGVMYVSFTYRSIEMVHNFVNDLWLNREYILKVAEEVECPEDTKIEITYFIMNAHSYAKPWSEHYKG
jgi:thymidylate synthase